jgi:hypothetical protein
MERGMDRGRHSLQWTRLRGGYASPLILNSSLTQFLLPCIISQFLDFSSTPKDVAQPLVLGNAHYGALALYENHANNHLTPPLLELTLPALPLVRLLDIGPCCSLEVKNQRFLWEEEKQNDQNMRRNPCSILKYFS